MTIFKICLEEIMCHVSGDSQAHVILLFVFVFCVWCCSLRGRQMCAKSIKTKIGRSNLPGFLIPQVKMLQLMGGTKPQDGFHKTQN